MKKSFIVPIMTPWSGCVISVAIGLLFGMVWAEPQKANAMNQTAWRTVDSLISAGLTQSAIDTVNRIYKDAKSADNQAQTIKSIIYRIKLESYGEEDAFVKTLNNLNEEINDSKFPATPLLHSMLAECYWHYYQNNRNRFYNRTQTENFDLIDIHTWDVRTIMEKTTSEYELSLKDRTALIKIKPDIFNAVISNAEKDEKLRPTLYDFLANRAIDFFSVDDNELAKPAAEFTLNDVNYFASFDKFMGHSIATPDSSSLKFRVLKLLQDLIAFHANNNDIEALIDWDLKRLSFVRQHAVMANKDSLYLKALISLSNLAPYSPASAEVAYDIASLYHEWANSYVWKENERYRWMNAEALAQCRKAMDMFPESFGAAQCKKLASEIASKVMYFTTESVNLPNKPFKALLTYENVDCVYWRQIRIGFEEYQKITGQGTIDSIVNNLAKLKPIKEWRTTVPSPTDYQKHSIEVEMPQLSFGHYVLLCASDSTFSFTQNAVAYGSFQISRISYINRKIPDRGEEFLFFNRETGAPLNGVTVKAWRIIFDRKHHDTKKIHQATYGSDQEGRIVIPKTGKRNENIDWTLECVKDDDRLFCNQEFYWYRHEKPQRNVSCRTFFFTDRSVYRPGQTVYFKGIVLKTDGDKNEIVQGRKTTVSFVNTNGQEVSKLALTTNTYGSIQGSFIAPINSLNGWMCIKNDNGSIGFSVEDYKRPKFEVTLDQFKGTNRLGERVHVTGQAKAYSGAAIDGAKVKYRVVRMARFPDQWWCWWREPSWCRETEISNGSSSANDTGGFSINFSAIADPSIPQHENPTFSYTVFVDVTDLNGETRSTSSTVTIGYASIKLQIDAGRQVKQGPDVSFPMTSANLNGAFEPLQGNILVYRLKSPDKIFRKRLWNAPDTVVMKPAEHAFLFPEDLYDNEDDITKWRKTDKVFEYNFDTQKDKTLTLTGADRWKPGCYVLEAQTKDKFGQEITAINYFTLFSENDKALPYPLGDWFVPVKTSCEPGEKAVFLVGSGYNDVTMLYEIEQKNEIIAKEWLTINNEQKRLEIPIEEKHRGNLSIHVTFVHSNRIYQHFATIDVPWTNKLLDVSFETFRSKLVPGEREEWRIKIAGKNKDLFAAEMVASLYDASLDAFSPHTWEFDIWPFYYPSCQWHTRNISQAGQAMVRATGWNNFSPVPNRYYPMLDWFGYEFEGNYYNTFVGGQIPSYVLSAPSPVSRAKSVDAVSQESEGLVTGKRKGVASIGFNGENAENLSASEEKDRTARELPKPDLSTIAARTNLNETAFFYPNLQTDQKGEIIVKFQIPEALTKWKMLGLAHTKDLEIGQITKELITQKDLMVIPNPPRFFRENDKITFTAKVSNLSDSVLSGSAQLFLFDASTNKPVDSLFRNTTAQRAFTAKKDQSAALAWDLLIPEGIGPVTCKVVAKANNFSDGEEQTVPVLSDRTLVTESLPLHIRKKETKKFTFENLASQNDNSKTLKNHKLTLEFTSNPAWYAVQALPYLMEYPYECSEQTFARFYANAIAAHIANFSPHIKAVFDQWKTQTPDALLSNLEKNRELKALAIEETPWLLDGKNESERKSRVALLFNLTKLAEEKDRALAKLRKLQMSDGGWPWFEGGPDDRYITQYIATGLARLDHLGMIDLRKDPALWNMIRNCLRYLDDQIRIDFEGIIRCCKTALDSNHLGPAQAQFLYARSYFKDIGVDTRNQTAFGYYLDQSKKYWPRNGRYIQGMIALALNRFDEKRIPEFIMRSLRENSIVNEEMGMYWKELNEGHSWWWYEAPIESQSLMIEAFDEVAHDTEAVENLKTWLIKSKQTQNWETTRATAEACYALLLRGINWLEKPSTVSIKLGDFVIDPANVKDAKAEAGTGYFKTSWAGEDINPAMGNVTVAKDGPGAAWGALYWQYFEQLDNIKSHETPLKLVKKLFLRQNTSVGPKITPVTENTTLRPGDKLTVRIELRADRDMEYVHLKDMRASGFEPLNVFSGYRWQDGLGYYESTRDAATNFFISFVRKGVYIFEYPMVVTHAGDFSNGITTIQSMYAPEFTSHSEGVRVKVER
jgi:uncharacterized protein YfaS (alpha-2-macroglobulin family)